MLSVIIKIVSFIIGIFGFFRNKKTKEEYILKEDQELADAIKRGDAETVSRIRERRKRYPNLYALFFLMFLIMGCSSMKYRNVPLTQGTMPYQIPSGEYVDTKGNVHVETNTRWSVSEEDLFNNTRQIKPIQVNESNIVLEHIEKYGVFYILTFIVVLCYDICRYIIVNRNFLKKT